MPLESDSRPWGSCHVLDTGEGFQVKRIEVLPHSRLSYQTHQHRAERWVVATGTATCLVGGETIVAQVGDCVSIGLQEPHRLSNETDDLLIVIETQLGAYTGEDDIIRLEDDYGR